MYSGTFWNVSILDLGSASDEEPTWDYALAEQQATWAWEEQEMHGSTGTGHSWNTQESEQFRPGKCRRQRTNLGLCPDRELGSLDWLGLARVGHAWLTWDWPFIEHPGI